MHLEDFLTYDRPATDWLEALPLGNGQLGAMVFGGPHQHRFQLNHGTAWSGSPHNQELGPRFTPDEAGGILSRARELIAAGEHLAAHEALKGLQHRHSQAFLPFADLVLSLVPGGPTVGAGRDEGGQGDIVEGGVGDYGRTLDLARGLCSTRYRISGHEVRVEAFASHNPSVLVITVDTELPEGLDVSLQLDSQLRIIGRTTTRLVDALGKTGDGTNAASIGLELKMPSDVAPMHDDGAILYSDDDSLSLQGAVTAVLEHDGGTPPDGATRLEGSTPPEGDAKVAATAVRHAVIYVAGATTFAGMGLKPQGSAATAAADVRATLDLAKKTGAKMLLRRHEEDHGALYGAATLSLGTTPWTGSNTAERLRQANSHPKGALAADPGLAALLFNYGRYLLISSSRPGGTPANLQGIWNEKLVAPWSSNFTTNINLEMNYWGADVTGLGECSEPLFRLIDALQETGAATAREYYGARGWAVHHNSDIWAYSKPVGHGSHSPEWSFWPMAGAWLVRHLWEHLQFGADQDFALHRAWPAIRGQAEFLLDLLVGFPDGSLGTSPSTSPENSFKVPGDHVSNQAGDHPGAARAATAASSTMDLTLCRDVFSMLVELAKSLGKEEDAVVQEAKAALPRIPKPSPGRNGRLREWLEDPPEWEEHHRHVSHLYLAFPGDYPLDPELEDAIRASLDGRGDDSTGWSLAWKTALRARLKQPAKVSDLLRLFFRDMTQNPGKGHGIDQHGGLYPNLFAAHPPFQIDGNLGYVGALAECLVQSHRGEIELLPALPAELPDGEVDGLRARPGVAVSLAWKDGLLDGASFTSPTARTIRVRYGTNTQNLRLQAHREESLDASAWAPQPQAATL
jgi:alpha-L-fucosidase 2